MGTITVTLISGQTATVGVATTPAVYEIGAPTSAAEYTASVESGVQGPQGNTGNAATITLGTFTTGDPGSNVVITNSGNTSAAVFNFTIPRGAVGATGNTGPIGPAPNTAARTVAIPDGTSLTINCESTDIATHINTQAVGTLTVNQPTGTPYDGQKLVIRIKSTNIQTFSWDSSFAGSTELGLPAGTSGGDVFDYVGFMYNSTNSKWQLLAKIFGV